MKFYIGVACKEHVENGIRLGICQFCHGKGGPIRRLKQNDYIIYYSSKIKMESNEIYQKFTAIGQMKDQEVYSCDMGNGFVPSRRNVEYLKIIEHVDIRPLIDVLDFIKNKNAWGAVFRYGFFAIDQKSFEIISTAMLGYKLDI